MVSAFTSYSGSDPHSMRIISWNARHRVENWRNVAAMDADVALLQEACAPPSDLGDHLNVDSDPWRTDGTANRAWRTSIVGLRRETRIERIPTRTLAEAGREHLAVSRLGTIAAARVSVGSARETITLASIYSVWESPHQSKEGSWIFADASAHRLISDLSALVERQKGHRIIAAGDLNCLFGHGEHGSSYWRARYQTIFDRCSAIGLAFVGPRAPRGRQASPWPDELPTDSLNVPTYYTSHQTPASATRQLDFVFASADLAPRVEVHARNGVDEWGPSDHCQIEIILHDP